MESFYKHYNVEIILLNVFDGFRNIQADFTGISINAKGVILFFLNIIVTACIILLFYFIGKKARILFKNYTFESKLDFFINIAIGYILIGSGIAILGMLSLFYAQIIFTFLLLLGFIAIFPIRYVKEYLKSIVITLREIFGCIVFNKWIAIGTFIFVFISFLRLIPPEIGEDSIGYHTDLPNLYKKQHTMMIASKEVLHVIPIPQLGEMSYVLVSFLGLRDSSRYIHYAFYLLIVIFLFYVNTSKKNISLGKYFPIFFVTASVVIRHSSKANVDFQSLFCWLLSVYLITKEKKITKQKTVLSGLFFGASIATKLWNIAFFPVFIIYILIKEQSIWTRIYISLLFTFFVLSVSGIWFLRAYLLTGDPVFPAFTQLISPGEVLPKPTIFTYFQFNKQIFSLPTLVAFSPLFFLGAISVLYRPFSFIKKVKSYGMFIFFLLLSMEHLFINYYIPRYLLNLYALGSIFVSAGMSLIALRFKSVKYIFFVVFFTIFAYYFLNTLTILPYGFGWADKNRYLTRILSKESSSYYDYDRLFDKHMLKDDLVATYSVSGFYYANFEYIDVGYIFDTNNRSFEQLKKYGATKLITLGGDIDWFCKKLSLTECSPHKYKLLASYPVKPQYLYLLNEN